MRLVDVVKKAASAQANVSSRITLQQQQQQQPLSMSNVTEGMVGQLSTVVGALGRIIYSTSVRPSRSLFAACMGWFFCIWKLVLVGPVSACQQTSEITRCRDAMTKPKMVVLVGFGWKKSYPDILIHNSDYYDARGWPGPRCV